MARIRSIRDTAKFFKTQDPETEITEATLRKMISEGSIPYCKTGIKYLVDIDVLLDMFGKPSDGLAKLTARSHEFIVNK